MLQRIRIFPFLQVFPDRVEPKLQQSVASTDIMGIDEDTKATVAGRACLFNCRLNQCRCQPSAPEILVHEASHFCGITDRKQSQMASQPLIHKNDEIDALAKLSQPRCP